VTFFHGEKIWNAKKLPLFRPRYFARANFGLTKISLNLIRKVTASSQQSLQQAQEKIKEQL
jgi:hypothetical protein